MPSADPPSTDAILRASVGDGGERASMTVTLDRWFQGLPATAHGGTVLALLDAVSAARGERGVTAVYHRRVPLERPLSLAVTREDDARRFVLADGPTALVTGTCAGTPRASAPAPATRSPATTGDRAWPLPVSTSCFACGTENPLGLRARLVIDDHAVGAMWEPPAALQAADGTLATVAVTSLLDEAAFWLGAAASGESGMTTELQVTLHGPVPFGRRLIVAGARAAVRAQPADPRYWDTEVQARDDDGLLVASARITFVAVRGAARRLVAGLLALNPPEGLRAVFPAYVR